MTALDKLFLVLIPVALEIADMLFLLLLEFVHLNIVVSEDGAASLVVLLVAKLLNLRLGFFGVEKFTFHDALLTIGLHFLTIHF